MSNCAPSCFSKEAPARGLDDQAVRPLLVFTVVLLARLYFISQYSADWPVSDQWDVDFTFIYKPWIDGTLSLGAFFRPESEHIETIPRLLNFALVAVSGSWNVLDQLRLQAVIAALSAALLVRWCGASWGLALVATLVFAGPYGYYNYLEGPALVYHLAILWAVLGLRAAVKGRPALALAAAACGFLTLGNGLITLLMVGAALIVWQRSLWGLAAIAGAVVLYFMISRHGLSYPEATITDRAHTFAAALGWPGWPWKYAGLLLWTPLLLVRWMRRDDSFRLAMALYGFVLLNMAAIGWARPTGNVEARYYELCALVVFAAAVLVGKLPWGGVAPAAQAAASLWLAALSWQSMESLRGFSVWWHRAEAMERVAVAAERAQPGAGLQVYQGPEGQAVLTLLYHGPVETKAQRLWAMVNDPAARRLRRR